MVTNPCNYSCKTSNYNCFNKVKHLEMFYLYFRCREYLCGYTAIICNIYFSFYDLCYLKLLDCLHLLLSPFANAYCYLFTVGVQITIHKCEV